MFLQNLQLPEVICIVCTYLAKRENNETATKTDCPNIHQEIAVFERSRAANWYTVSQYIHLLLDSNFLSWQLKNAKRGQR